MKILITGGSTNVMIDQVRCISNIFKGRTAEDLAYEFAEEGANQVTLLTSNPGNCVPGECYFERIMFKTYDDLYNEMERLIPSENYDVIIHSAAVSDYKVEGTYIITPESLPAPNNSHVSWNRNKIDSSTKIGSGQKGLYLKLVPTEKIIDKIRGWGFKGVLVKFKLQVGISDGKLIEIASRSREHSNADIIVANRLERAKEEAFIIDETSSACVSREKLASSLLACVKDLYLKNNPKGINFDSELQFDWNCLPEWGNNFIAYDHIEKVWICANQEPVWRTGAFFNYEGLYPIPTDHCPQCKLKMHAVFKNPKV